MQVDGVSLKSLSEAQMTEFRGKTIGIVFQQYHLVSHLTALENVLLPLEIMGLDSQFSRASEILSEVGLKDRAEHFPAQLSGGEQQRVALARAVVHGPKLLLADEPSGNLDQQTGREVMKVIFELVQRQNITFLLVTHDRDLARMCQRVCQLKDGQIHDL